MSWSGDETKGEPVDIRAIYHHESSIWWAESDDLPGFSAAGESLADVRGMLHEALAEFVTEGDVRLLEHLDGGALLVPLGARIDVHGVIAGGIATYTSGGSGAAESMRALTMRMPNLVSTAA